MAPDKWALAEPFKNRSFDHWKLVAKFDSTAGISIWDTTVKISTAIHVLAVTNDQHLTFVDGVTKSCQFL